MKRTFWFSHTLFLTCRSCWFSSEPHLKCWRHSGWRGTSGSCSPANLRRRAFKVSAGKSLQGSCPPLLPTSMQKISLSFSRFLSALSLTQAKRHPNWPAEPLHISPSGKSLNPSVQTQAKWVKLDPKFEKHDREVRLQKHWLIISTLFTFGPGEEFVVCLMCMWTHRFPLVFRDFCEKCFHDINQEIKAKHDKLHLQEIRAVFRDWLQKSIMLITVGAAETWTVSRYQTIFQCFYCASFPVWDNRFPRILLKTAHKKTFGCMLAYYYHSGTKQVQQWFQESRHRITRIWLEKTTLNWFLKF